MKRSIEDLMKTAKCNLELSGYTVNDQHTSLVFDVLSKKISREEFLAEALRRAKEKKE